MDVNVIEFMFGEPIVYEVLTKKSVKDLKYLKSNKKRHYSFDIK